MQGRTAATLPAAALAGMSGSAIIARAMPTRSQAPSSRARSPSAGWLILPSAITATPPVRAFTGAAQAMPIPGAVPIGGISR